MNTRNFSAWIATATFLLVLTAQQAQAQTTNVAAVNAGFPTGSIWASKTQATAGDSITIFTVLYNSGTNDVKGSAAFKVDGAVVATKSFNVDTGSSEILSTSWTAQKGTHIASATIQKATDGQTNETVNVSSATTGTVTIIVAAAPPPSVLNQAAAAAGAVITSSTPVVENAAQHIYSATENLRQSGINYLEGQLATTTPRFQREVLGTSTENIQSTGGTAGDSSSPPSGWWSWLAAVALVIFSSPLLFYPMSIILGFAVLYILSVIWGTST